MIQASSFEPPFPGRVEEAVELEPGAGVELTMRPIMFDDGLSRVVKTALADQRQLVLDASVAAAKIGHARIGAGHQPPERNHLGEDGGLDVIGRQWPRGITGRHFFLEEGQRFVGRFEHGKVFRGGRRRVMHGLQQPADRIVGERNVHDRQVGQEG